MADEKKAPQKPKYRLTEKAYIDDRLLDPEQMPLMPTKDDDDVFDQNATPERKPLIIEYEGIPGPHMVPVNEEARAIVAKYPQASNFMDPINSLEISPPSVALPPPTASKVVGAKK